MSNLPVAPLLRLASSLPKGSTERRALLQTLREASLQKNAHRPQMEGMSLAAYREGRALMTYHIDEDKNHSKFYEALVTPQPDGTFSYQRRWGALTDHGPDRMRVDGAKLDKFGLSEMEALYLLNQEKKKRVQRGYTDAFKTRPLGQYPVGLSRSVGFGWGTQSITQCVPALRELSFKIDEVLRDVDREDLGSLQTDIQAARDLLDSLPSSSMATELDKLLHPPMNRLLGNPRFIQDPARTMGELKTVHNYLRRQLVDCNV